MMTIITTIRTLLAWLATDLYHPSSNFAEATSEGCFILLHLAERVHKSGRKAPHNKNLKWVYLAGTVR